MVRARKRVSSPKLWTRSAGKRLVRVENPYKLVSVKFVCRSCSSSNNKNISLLDLPDECILMILDKLNLEPHELCQMMHICKRFYELSFNPRLWQIADFRFSSFLYINNGAINVESIQRNISELERREMFAQFLIKRKAILSFLRLHCDISDEFETVNSLIEKCCSKELNKVVIKWTFMHYNHLIFQRKLAKVICLRDILKKLSVQCPFINFVKSQIDESCTTARIIGTMANIQHLELSFLGVLQQDEDTNAIEILLLNLKKLKNFKLKVRQSLDAERPGCILKSDSLQLFDCSWSKGFHVQFIDLPRLHTYLAFNTFDLYQGVTSPCLFKLLEEGCPVLQKLNFKKFKSPGLANVNLSDVDKSNMYICSCDSHA